MPHDLILAILGPFLFCSLGNLRRCVCRALALNRNLVQFEGSAHSAIGLH